jgi:ADP-heptose:LPS heptosyltransferase
VKPFEDKHGSFNEAVVIHPGRHWPSKTFPKEFWQEIIDKLVTAKFKVVIIGKDLNAEQGIVKGLDFSRCVDLVGKTSILETLSILGVAKVLLSNDSSPVHLAGGTDINIGIIPTVKSPDYILPYRHGSIYYKAKSLCRGQLWDSFLADPLQMYEIMADSCDHDLLKKCLPTVDEVLDYVRSCY